VRAAVQRTLRAAGYRVIETSHGREALALVERLPLHLVITDVNLPDLSGPEVVERMRAVQPQLKAIYMSAEPSPPAGASFLQKPFTPDALVRRVRAVLDAGPSSP
jgi:DNA-binding response OmpR family regulator